MHIRSAVYSFLCIFSLLFTLSAQELNYPKAIIVPHGGVACSEFNAAQVGARILQEGGTAMDAMVATGMALAVTYPFAGNIGGGGFLLYYHAKTRKVTAFDFRETAPHAASRTMYLDSTGQPIAEKSRLGGLAVGVPGTVKGLAMAHYRFGRKKWATLLQPAIKLARYGFVVDSAFYRSIQHYQKALSQFPSTRQIFLPNGQPPPPGTLFIQPELANTLSQIARKGPDAFYTGKIARLIAHSVQQHGGILTVEDLDNYRVKERQPIVFNYRGYTIYAMAPPSSGGLTLMGILKSLEAIPLAEQYERNSAPYIALISEIEKYWYARRNQYLGDPDFVAIPFQQYLSPQWHQKALQRAIRLRPYPARKMSAYRAITGQEHPQTTHITIVDASGNMAVMTYTLNGGYGSKLIAEGTGILLNNEMDDFTVKPGSPNMFGLVQGTANAIQPGKRMLSSMTPTLVLKNGQLIGGLGSPGGATIITTVLQVLLNKLDYGLSLAEAVAAARFHQQWLPDSIIIEKRGFSPHTIQQLTRWGFHWITRSSLGDVQAIWETPEGWEIVSDPRGSGFPVGF